MVARTFTSVDEVRSSIGTPIGTTDWVLMEQDSVNQFADVTRDHQWIHVDTQRAAESPFGGTIVHGYYTLALLPAFARELYEFQVGSARLNYGLEKVRFPAPVPVGSRIRGTAEVIDVRESSSGARVTVSWTVEVEGSTRPACVAEAIALLVP